MQLLPLFLITALGFLFAFTIDQHAIKHGLLPALMHAGIGILVGNIAAQTVINQSSASATLPPFIIILGGLAVIQLLRGMVQKV